jgi:phosphatidate phosphatase PAH1
MRPWTALVLLSSCVPPGGDAGAPISGSAATQPSSSGPVGTAEVVASAPGPALAAVADECGPPAQEREPLRHHRSKLAMAVGHPHHSALDGVGLAGSSLELAGKLSYGTMRKDLEDETVVGWLRRTPACDGWAPVGRGLTDGAGRVALSLPAGTLEEPGRYPFALVVAADGSRADGELWLFAPGTKVVVFDIDGTLTGGDEELFAQLLSGTDPVPRRGAVEVARAHRDHAIQPLYLSGRPYQIAGLTRRWLSSHGFPPGPLLTPARTVQARPGEAVERYKREVLNSLTTGAKVVIVRAYGNAESDLCAYAEAGVAPARTFMVGALGGHACAGHDPSQPLESYVEHLAGLGFED